VAAFSHPLWQREREREVYTAQCGYNIAYRTHIHPISLHEKINEREKKKD
jgi:hypothetical protein